MPPLDSAAAYLSGRTPGERRDAGEVYTPHAVADFVLARCHYPDSAASSVLDPAAGCGAFLEAAQARRVAAFAKVEDPAHFRPALKLVRQLERELHGLDISAGAVRVARERLRTCLHGVVHADAVATYEPSVIVGDFLTIAAKATQWPSSWPSAGFDLVVGNPPYVQLTRISKGRRETLRAEYQSATGRFDLYALFLDAATRILRPETGVMGFVVPNRLLTTKAAKGVRDILATSVSVHEIFDFNEARLFDEHVDAYPLIIIASRGPPRGVVIHRFNTPHEMALETVHAALENARIKPRSLRTVRVKQALLQRDEWSFDDPTQSRLKLKMETAGTPLGELVTTWGIGTATGRDGVFVVKPDLASRLESNLLRRTLRGRDIQPFRIQDPKLHLIVPYEEDEELVRVNARQSEHRRVFDYLAIYREDLERRSCVTREKQKKKWFEHHESVDVRLAERRKIVWPDIANKNAFAVDEGNYHPLHSVYFMVPGDDPHALVGILNSTPAEYYLKTLLPRMNGAHYRYQKRFIARLPIPKFDRDATRKLRAAAKAADSERCDTIVSPAYGLTEDELRLMRRSSLRYRSASAINSRSEERAKDGRQAQRDQSTDSRS